MNCVLLFYFHAAKVYFYMNKYLCHMQDVVLLRIVVLQRLGILRMVYRRFFRFKQACLLSLGHGSHGS